MKYLLFVPVPAHREALIGEGPCNSRPPVRYYARDGGLNGAPSLSPMSVAWGTDGLPHDYDWAALVLVWNDKVVHAGVDLLWRVQGTTRDSDSLHNQIQPNFGPAVEAVFGWAQNVSKAGFGWLVYDQGWPR